MYNKRNCIRKKNTEDRKNMLINSIANKYTKQLENLEEKKTSKNEEVAIPIIIKFDDENGRIIDDRE